MESPLALRDAVRLVCPTCGCSPVRLGLPRERWLWGEHRGRTFPFCCRGCQERFEAAPDEMAARAADLVICPTCLGETALGRAESVEYQGEPIYFCGCPYCPEQFAREPGALIGRLTGRDFHPGVLAGANACCA